MRVLNTAGAALLARLRAGERIPLVQLVELHFDVVLYLTTAGRPVEWGGHTWLPAGLGPIEAIEHTTPEMPPLKFTLPGVSAEQKAVALEAGAEGTLVVVYDALLDPDTGACGDALQAWRGTLNVPSIIDGTQADIIVTAEHRGVHALRPKPTRYTNDEQLRLHPGDTCLDFDPATDAAPLAWPAASFFKQ